MRRVEILEFESEPDRMDFAVEQQLMDDAVGDFDGDREANALGSAIDCGVDSDQLEPSAFSNGPPELPGLMDASVCSRPWKVWSAALTERS